MRQNLAITIALVAAVAAVYWPVGRNAFVDFDDNAYIRENPHVTAGVTCDGLAWAMTTTQGGSWHPLTWLSHMLDCTLFGLWAGGHHLMSAALHAAGTAVLFAALRRMTGAPWPSAVVAALFALHPQHVESVAWASERKDTLSTLFWMLTLWSYARYAERPAVRRYVPILLFFVAGLLAKPMLVTLPLVLRLLDFWPLGRLGLSKMVMDGWHAHAAVRVGMRTGVERSMPRQRTAWACHPEEKGPVPFSPAAAGRLVLEKVPLLALAVAAGVAAYLAQSHQGAMRFGERFPLESRLSGAIVAYVAYLGQTFWPTGLAAYYPFVVRPAWQVAAAGAALVAVTVLAIAQARRRPYLAIGWLWYLGTFVPVIGLVQIGAQSMADRYTYVPLIGIFVAVVWGAADLVGGWRHGAKALAAAAVFVLAACAALSWQQVQYWSNTRTLFEHAAAVTEKNPVAHLNLGRLLYLEKNYTAAVAEYTLALEATPRDTEIRSAMAMALAACGRTDEAVAHLREAIRIEPGWAVPHANLGSVLVRQGKLDAAIAEYRTALRSDGDDAGVHGQLGEALVLCGRLDEAAAQFREVLHLAPDQAAAHANLATILGRQGRPAEALEHFREAVRLRPDDSDIYVNMAAFLYSQKQWDSAIACVREALRLDPTRAMAENTWAACLVAQGKPDEAVAHFRAAIRLNPAYANAHFNLAGILARQGKPAEAVAEFQEVLRLEPGSADGHRGMASALVVLGRRAEAAAHLASALQARPDWPGAMRELAWLRATAPEADVRNAAEAVRLAERACELSGRKDPGCLDALGAAYAEAGRFDDAASAAREAIALARAAGRGDLAAEVEARLKLYEARKPYRLAP